MTDYTPEDLQTMSLTDVVEVWSEHYDTPLDEVTTVERAQLDYAAGIIAEDMRTQDEVAEKYGVTTHQIRRGYRTACQEMEVIFYDWTLEELGEIDG